MDERTAVYRLFGEGDALLYVGIGTNPQVRWWAHSREKPWWNQVSRKSVEWHPDRPSALAAELRAIQTEGPLFNIVGTPEHAARINRARAARFQAVRARRQAALTQTRAITGGATAKPTVTPELTNLVTALKELADLPPVERARRCPGLIEAAKAALSRERDAAVAEVYDDGNWSQPAIGRELGMSRQKVNDMIARHWKRATLPQEG